MTESSIRIFALILCCISIRCQINLSRQPVDGPGTVKDVSVRFDSHSDTARNDGRIVEDGPLQVSDAGCACVWGCGVGGNCKRLVPANGYTVDQWSPMAMLSSAAAISTTNCSSNFGLSGSIQLPQISKAAKACVMSVEKFTLAAGTTLKVTGDYPLVLIVNGDVNIDGQLDISADGPVPGPGGGAGGLGATTSPGVMGGGPAPGRVCGCLETEGDDDCGGGGGGHGQDGAKGGWDNKGCGKESIGGGAHGGPGLIPITTGSGGASGGFGSYHSNTLVGSGGGGGGTIQISSQGTIAIKGSINAGGGGGGNGVITPNVNTNSVSGGGGGAGGGILLEGVSISGGGFVAANGGGGGAANNGMCTGSSAGQDGEAKDTAALGGPVTGCGVGGNGGTGAKVPIKPLPGENAGGGGGGACGRIHFRWKDHKLVSPVNTSGVVYISEAERQ